MAEHGRMPGLAATAVVALLIALGVVLHPAPPAAAAVPTGFSEVTAFSGLVNPTVFRFAPDGRIFVAEKRGTIQMYDSLGDASPALVVDLRTEVHNFWDRGLLGLAIDPGFPTRPYLYALYTFDAAIGGTAPRFGTPDTDSDGCPDPPGATGDGCVVSGKLVKLTLDLTNVSPSTTRKQDLINDWCQQYPSHSIGDLIFGRDGALYASGGDGASFNFADYGQDGNPLNPCGDPPGGAGATLTPPTAEGGALRSQDLRTLSDPVGLNGSVIRVNPDTGAALPDNPNAGAADANARRIVAYGMRNPFRMSGRPGTDELWIGDVGWDTWEEIDRLQSPTAGVTNFGWPCYEGNDRQPSYDGANLSICENLYAQGNGDTKPYYPYRHGQPLNASDNCNAGSGSSASGLSFQFYSGGPYPPEYDGALFFADYSRNCIWVMTKGTDGLPDKLKAKPFVSPAAGPVDLELSPQGEVFYADLNGGTIKRVVYTGTGTPTSCPSGQYLTQYFTNMTLSGSAATTACEPAPLNHDWGTSAPAGIGPDNWSARWSGSFDFSAAGTYTFTAVADDGIRVWVDGTILIDQWKDQSATTYTAARSLTAGSHAVKVEWYDNTIDAVAKLSWAAPAGHSPPSPQITSPVAGTTWKVGDTLTFSGSATDPEDGTLPASALSWNLVLQHCPTGTGCHTHQLLSWTGASGGSFPTPDHEYPAYLELSLTATDSSGMTATVIRRLDPQTVPITMASQPAGLQLTLGSVTAVTPFTSTLIVGATSAVTAPTPQTLSGTSYAFGSWSDSGAATHNITAGASPVTYTATYVAGCAAGTYRAEYFANRTLSGAPVSTVCEANPLDRNWGTGGPAGAGQNNFSARFTGSFSFPGGNTQFTASADDGVRVWLDGTLVIDRWGRTVGTTTVTRAVPAGTHSVRVEYFDKTGPAYVRTSWRSV
jgi:glucose/arabinose dehydrogenase